MMQLGDKWFHVIVSPVFDEKGILIRFMHVITEITEHKFSEKALEESETLFRKLFQAHAAVKIIIDPDTGNIVDANRAAEEYYGGTA